MNTTQVKENCIVHVRQDSDTDLEHLFNSVLNKDGQQQAQPSVPLRMRNLPPSFFQPAIVGGAPQHIRTRSLPASLGQMVSQQEQTTPQQQQPNFMVPNHQRKHSHDALEQTNGAVPPNSALPPGWESRTTALGQKYYVK